MVCAGQCPGVVWVPTVIVYPVKGTVWVDSRGRRAINFGMTAAVVAIGVGMVRLGGGGERGGGGEHAGYSALCGWRMRS